MRLSILDYQHRRSRYARNENISHTDSDRVILCDTAGDNRIIESVIRIIDTLYTGIVVSVILDRSAVNGWTGDKTHLMIFHPIVYKVIHQCFPSVNEAQRINERQEPRTPNVMNIMLYDRFGQIKTYQLLNEVNYCEDGTGTEYHTRLLDTPRIDP